MKEESILNLNVPLILVGDIHGQFKDLLRIFEINGYPPTVNIHSQQLIFPLSHTYYVDNLIYGFYDECRLRYTLEIWNLLQAIFNCLPLYARINKNILYAWRNITRHCVMKFAS
ncbi:unnamed protein product [Dracunculus medinensis]|uniref:protein-serine/threonine phosphatase n=1 Tax=Dracunculus medinensis TaxID=318479 RepID=A0A0N4U612_DRAME|nr:unnamed protein product [Dracunculus medinensis]